MENILHKLKQNGLYIIIPIIFISFLLINLNVVYFGDDYYYLTFNNLELSEYFSKLIGHYQNDNGRFIVHMLATLFLKVPLPFWAILNSVFLTGICYFAANVIAKGKKENLPLLCVIIFFFIAILDISVTRQSVYWLTGSFNYVYPLFLFFAYWFCLNKIDNKKFFILSILVGFISAASMEQTAMMTFGLTVLVTLTHFKGFRYSKNFMQENTKLFILCFVTLVGLCTVILAPSQFRRIELENAKEEETSIQTTLLENGALILSEYTISPNIIPYCILFNVLTIAYTLKNGTKREKYIFFSLALTNFLITLFNVNFFASPAIASSIKYLLVVITLLTYGINFIYLNFKIYHCLINPLTIAAILLIGSQGMMIVSPVLGPRNFIFGFVLFAFMIAILSNNFSLKKLYIPTCVLLFIALTVNLKTANGYYQTRLIEEKNQEILAASSDILKNKNEEITLYKFLDDNYAWSMPYVSSYHEFYFKHFYQIKCKINWE